MENTTSTLDAFLSMAKSSINEKGIYPHILIYETEDGKMHVTAMALQPENLYTAVKKIMETENPTQLIVGMDRSNKDGQGVDMKYHSVLTIAYYAIGKWSIGAMPYASKDDIGEIQWDNEWWNNAVNKELKAYNFLESLVTDEVIGHAYVNKISITSAVKTSMAQYYEGFINVDKLSEKVQTFLTDNSLDINDRKSVINVIKVLGKKFEIIYEDYGFWTAKAGRGIFPARSSKTKVYLEGVEAIVHEINLAELEKETGLDLIINK